MTYTRKNSGVCSISTQVDIDENNIIQSVTVLGGCNGNLQGISSLLKGMKAEDAIERLRGITCGNKKTSCPDQIAAALAEAINSRV